MYFTLVVDLLRATATVVRYPLLWPDKPSIAISILAELPNTLTKYPSMYKCRPCIHSTKTPVHPCISSAATYITSFALQPSYSNPITDPAITALAAINPVCHVTTSTTMALASYATTSVTTILASYATISIAIITTNTQPHLPP